jgi:hypothetical protein
MIDTERELADLARLHDDILKERAFGLKESAEAKKADLVRREEALARLRGQVALLKASLAAKPKPAFIPAAAPAAAKAQAAPPAVKSVVAPAVPKTFVRPSPAKEAAPVSAPVAASPARLGFKTLTPYLAIAAFAGFVEISGARRAPQAPRDLPAFARPAATVVASGHAAAKGAPVVAEEDRSQEALLLVHEWTLPGDDAPLGERLSTLDLPGSPPAWSVERTAERAYRVTFQEPDSAPFSFEADLDARVVWPTAETQELLAPRFAALRDAAR